MPAPGSRPPARERPYRRTLFDRYGPDFGRVLFAAGWASLGAVMFLPVALFHSPPGWPLLVTIPLFYIVGWAAITAIALVITRPAGAVADFYLAPTGASTPYEEQFSQEEALVMQRRVPEALESFERRIAADPAGVRVRVKAADLYAGLGNNPQRAAELFRDVQRLPGLGSGDDLYVGNRLADLYMGPLDTPARALVELRRLLDRYPESRVAPHLRQAIAALKARHVTDDRGA
jgi:hypothetical protein